MILRVGSTEILASGVHELHWAEAATVRE